MTQIIYSCQNSRFELRIYHDLSLCRTQLPQQCFCIIHLAWFLCQLSLIPAISGFNAKLANNYPFNCSLILSSFCASPNICAIFPFPLFVSLSRISRQSTETRTKLTGGETAEPINVRINQKSCRCRREILAISLFRVDSYLKSWRKCLTKLAKLGLQKFSSTFHYLMTKSCSPE